jgi:drug/metabolite transporter (DMT)-like permease
LRLAPDRRPTLRHGATAAPRRGLSRHTLGWIAIGVAVVGFSLGSTLVKLADSPPVMLAFWRMVTTTLIWNALLISTGRRASWTSIRRAMVPGILFGLNLTVFFVGATNNSVANAELIGALAPFLIVPLGAMLFGEAVNRQALLFALPALVGVCLVLFAAPPTGDSSLKGNLFCVLAMFSWAGYVTATRLFRGPLDVIEFMASALPVATLTVLPFALLNGFGNLSWHGWKYVLLLTFVTGLSAHGLIVFAQRTIGIGTIGVAQVAQPALAAFWSFLILGEPILRLQVVGMGLVLAGLLAFITATQRANRHALLPAAPTSIAETSLAIDDRQRLVADPPR